MRSEGVEERRKNWQSHFSLLLQMKRLSLNRMRLSRKSCGEDGPRRPM